MDMLSFSWLPAFLSGFWAYLKGVSVADGVSLYGVLLAVCLLVVAVVLLFAV